MKSKRFAVLLVAWAIPSACTGMIEAEAAVRRDVQWRAVHLIGYSGDDALQTLGENVSGLQSGTGGAGRKLPGLAEMGVNVLILEVRYGFEFESHPELRRGEKPITKKGARALAKLCRKHSIRLIPLFQCLGHQSWKQRTGPLLTKYPELDLTPGAYPENKGIYCREWDPLNPKVNRIVFALMDELIDAFEADAFHVGMDEVFLLGSKHSPSTRGKDPAKLFAKAVNDYHRHLVKKRRVEMLMWGDRLIDGKKFRYGKWESSMNGTAPAVDMIPRDIIVCDWHYGKKSTYKSIPMFIGKGFRVLPAGWKEVHATLSLIKYSRTQRSPLMLGHLFTTWSVGKDRLTRFPPLVEGLKVLAESGNKRQ